MLWQAARAISSCNALTWLSLAGCTQVCLHYLNTQTSQFPTTDPPTHSCPRTGINPGPFVVCSHHCSDVLQCLQLDDVAVTRVLSGTWRLHVLRLDRLWRLTNAVIVGLDDLFGLRDLSLSGCTGGTLSAGSQPL